MARSGALRKEKFRMPKRGYCLPSQDIRQWLLDNKINAHRGELRVLSRQDIQNPQEEKPGQLTDRSLEKRIQPASFEPTLGDEMYELIGDEGILLHDPRATVSRRIKSLPLSARPKVSIIKPTMLLPGHSYLVPQMEDFTVDEYEEIRMSPKSTSGRAFLHERMIADYHEVFNTISGDVMPGTPIKTWLLIQPTFWPVYIQAGLNLTQLRFFEGLDAQLTDREILREHAKKPLFYMLDENGEFVPGKPKVKGGLVLHSEGIGKKTHGVIGLRARASSVGLDLSQVGTYDPMNWFDFILSSHKAKIRPQDHMLLSTVEYLQFPRKLSGEVDRYSTDTIEGELDDAGFFDPDFVGQGVAEVRSREMLDRPIKHMDELTKMQFYRMRKSPDKIYGKSGNNYQGQMGPKAGKQFKPINFQLVAKEYKNIEKIVLTQESTLLLEQRRAPFGFEIITEGDARAYERLLADPIHHTRYDCERDREVLQIVPYIIVFGPKNTVFVYDRSNDPTKYTDWRLFNKRSIGVGGHEIPADAPNYLTRCIERELGEEIKFLGSRSKPKWLGTIRMVDREVDEVHFAYVMGIHTRGGIEPAESSIKQGALVSIQELVREFEEKKGDLAWLENTESWTQELIPRLPFLSRFKGYDVKL